MLTTIFKPVVILEYSGQSSQEICLLVRQQNIFSLIEDPLLSFEKLEDLNAQAIIISDGHGGFLSDIDKKIIDSQLPILVFGSLKNNQFNKNIYLSSEISLETFLNEKVKAEKNWTMDNYAKYQLEAIKKEVGTDKVICGLSGGVDSSVVATLINKAIGEQLVAVFVNNGLLRENEAQYVNTLFTKRFNFNLKYIDATENFLTNLKGITDSETKRKIVGKVFIDVFEEASKQTQGAKFLAQGTLYPDVLESINVKGGKKVAVKSHHNVGGLPEKLNFSLLEPLRYLFKDEVRQLGKVLDLPGEVINRHPFPGPGLAVRCVGEVTKERLETLRKADAIFIEEIRKFGLYDKIWQALVCLLPLKSVGIKEGKRSYVEVCSLRAVISKDAMSATWYPLPPELLRKVSDRIGSEVEGINRILFDVTDKPPATIEWE
ncbi:MAG: glutamine-hydrolyzing GMP synthase [Sphaerochaetaceae bacterium]